MMLPPSTKEYNYKMYGSQTSLTLTEFTVDIIQLCLQLSLLWNYIS